MLIRIIYLLNVITADVTVPVKINYCGVSFMIFPLCLNSKNKCIKWTHTIKQQQKGIWGQLHGSTLNISDRRRSIKEIFANIQSASYRSRTLATLRLIIFLPSRKLDGVGKTVHGCNSWLSVWTLRCSCLYDVDVFFSVVSAFRHCFLVCFWLITGMQPNLSLWTTQGKQYGVEL